MSTDDELGGVLGEVRGIVRTPPRRARRRSGLRRAPARVAGRAAVPLAASGGSRSRAGRRCPSYVHAATTPGRRAPLTRRRSRVRPWATGDRTTRMCNVPGRECQRRTARRRAAAPGSSMRGTRSPIIRWRPPGSDSSPPHRLLCAQYGVDDRSDSRCNGTGSRTTRRGPPPRSHRAFLPGDRGQHQEPGRAEAALEPVVRPERLLDRVQRRSVGSARPSTVRTRGALGLNGEHQAGPHGFTIERGRCRPRTRRAHSRGGCRSDRSLSRSASAKVTRGSTRMSWRRRSRTGGAPPRRSCRHHICVSGRGTSARTRPRR